MHPFRDLSSTVTQNGYSNHLTAGTHLDSPVIPYRGKYTYRSNMAITTDGYAPSAYHNHGHHSHLNHNGHLHNNTRLSSHIDPNSLTSNVQRENANSNIWDIWAENFYEGMRLLRKLAQDARYVAVDTEFPGVVAKVYGEYSNGYQQAYHNIKINIDMLKPIQIGFSFFNDKGGMIEPVSTIQFNIKWNVDKDTHAVDSIELLESSGMDFERLKLLGIELHDFAEAFIASGLPLNENITWIGFHRYVLSISIPANLVRMTLHIS